MSKTGDTEEFLIIRGLTRPRGDSLEQQELYSGVVNEETRFLVSMVISLYVKDRKLLSGGNEENSNY